MKKIEKGYFLLLEILLLDIVRIKTNQIYFASTLTYVNKNVVILKFIKNLSIHGRVIIFFFIYIYIYIYLLQK